VARMKLAGQSQNATRCGWAVFEAAWKKMMMLGQFVGGAHHVSGITLDPKHGTRVG
jgi:hypothetical protein